MSGGSFYSHNSLVLHFGLGKSEVADRLEIRSPSGIVQTWNGVAANHNVIATEGSERLQQIKPSAY